MLELTIWVINTRTDIIAMTYKMYGDNEEMLEEMAENYIDCHSTDEMCMRYHIDEVCNG